MIGAGDQNSTMNPVNYQALVKPKLDMQWLQDWTKHHKNWESHKTDMLVSDKHDGAPVSLPHMLVIVFFSPRNTINLPIFFNVHS